MVRRQSAASHIQSFWRIYKAKKELQELKEAHQIRLAEEAHQRWLNTCATKIQALWRGYQVRKETDMLLNSIRNRLSFYIQNRTSSDNTLGTRIINSLKIIKHQCHAIDTLGKSLVDLNTVTSLSPECCEIFSKEGAIHILYEFIFNCNRSTPHMDLIKMCLGILINLAKYAQTCQHVIGKDHWIGILLSLLQAYHLSNPSIFMNVCALLILLAQNESNKQRLLAHEGLVKKLHTIFQILSRKANLKQNKQIGI
jgi:hypothetical protein